MPEEFGKILEQLNTCSNVQFHYTPIFPFVNTFFKKNRPQAFNKMHTNGNKQLCVKIFDDLFECLCDNRMSFGTHGVCFVIMLFTEAVFC